MNQYTPRNFTILIVEDHKFSRKALVNMLIRAGYENLLCAQDGEEALEKLSKHQVDLIITDINMPKINGLELIKSVRQGMTKVPNTTSIIAVTTLSDTATISSCMTLEVDAFLVKPITVQNAQQQIQAAISEPRHLYQRHLYDSVSTDVTLNTSEDKPEPDSPKIKEVSSHVVEINALSQLQDGMVVLQNIHVKTGGCLLKAGTTLNAKLIRRLNELSSIIEIKPFHARIDKTELANQV